MDEFGTLYILGEVSMKKKKRWHRDDTPSSKAPSAFDFVSFLLLCYVSIVLFPSC